MPQVLLPGTIARNLQSNTLGIIGGVSKHQSSSLCKQIICRFANTTLQTLRSTTRSSLGITCGARKFGKKRLATGFMY